jgi:hypothetical protein
MNLIIGSPRALRFSDAALTSSANGSTLQSERHEGDFKLTLAHGTDRLESDRLVLRRITPDDLPFFARIHALPEVTQYLYPGGRPRSPEEAVAWVQAVLESYEQLGIGFLAVLRKEDRVLIGRCGLTDLAVEPAAPRARNSPRMVRARTRARGHRADIRE